MGWCPDVVIVFWGEVYSFLFWATPTELTTHQRNPQLKPSRLAPFLSKLGKRGGVCGHVQKSEAHTLGAGCGVSQANEAAINPKLTGLCQHEIVSGILKK